MENSNYSFETFDASELTRTLRATVHKSGKLGFSADAIEVLGLFDGMGALFHKNKNEPEGENLYMEFIQSVELNKKSFRLNRAGDYIYISTKPFFQSIGLDYESRSVYYDLVKVVPFPNRFFYKMIQGETKGRGRRSVNPALQSVAKSIGDEFPAG